jgi:hypothetical protein
VKGLFKAFKTPFTSLSNYWKGLSKAFERPFKGI